MPSLSMGPIQIRQTPGWQMFHRYDISTDEFQVFIRLTDHDGKRWGVLPFQYTEGPAMPAPSVSGLHEGVVPDVNGFLQAALDLAWEIGLRPAGYDDQVRKGELEAVRDHLEDMRRLAKVPRA